MLHERYEMRGLIGRGGMAEVHRAYDLHLERDVAVKQMRAGLAGETEHRRFASEMRLLAGLNHPHLVTLLDAGFGDADGAGDQPWLVMELVDGPSLARRLGEGAMPADEVARAGSDLAAALAHVHVNGIVHRDVKPANVLLTADGEPKLADFGIARVANERSDLTGTGRTIGTASYLAPEQVRGSTVTGACDVYALGLVLLEALTGLRAYRGTPTEAAFARLHHSPIIPVSLGAAWVRVLAAMTATDPGERPDAARVARQLAALPAGRPVLVAPTVTAPTITTPLRVPHLWRRRSALAATGAAVLLLLSAGVAEVAGGSGPRPPVAAADAPAPQAQKDLDRPRGVAPARSPTHRTIAPAPAEPKMTKHHHQKPDATRKRHANHHADHGAHGKGKGKARHRGHRKG